MRRTAATTPPIMAAVGSEHVSARVDEEHSSSLNEEMATEQSVSSVISSLVTTILAPPLTQSSIREMRESLSVSEVPSSLARYVTYVGD